MRRIIEGKVYDTETATEVAEVSGLHEGPSDFSYDNTHLYRSPRGRWFVSGHGGPTSRWARRVGTSYTGGDGIEVLDDWEAQCLIERNAPERFVEFFGEPEEG